MTVKVLVALLAGVLLVATQVGSQGCLDTVSALPYGMTYAVELSGTCAIVGAGEGLLVVDLSEPTVPQVLGRVPLPAWVSDVAIIGTTVFAATGAGLVVVDVSDPHHPVEVGACAMPSGASGVAVAGSHAYVAARHDGLRVVDVSNASNPVELAHLDSADVASGVAVEGGYVYVADGAAGIQVVDVSAPSNPFEVGRADTDGNALDLAVSGGRAYVADQSGGLVVLDVSAPSSPTQIGWLGSPSIELPLQVAVQGVLALVADYYRGLVLVDISVPTEPVEIGRFGPYNRWFSVAVEAEHAVMGDRGRLLVVDLSKPSDPVEVGSLVAGPAVSLELSSGFAAVGLNEDYGVSSDEIRLVDISSWEAPTEVGSLRLGESAEDFALSGNTLYTLDRSGLHVFDVSVPSSPVELGAAQLAHGWGQAQVEVDGSHAYVFCDGELHVLDVSDPSVPTQVGTYVSSSSSGEAGGMAVVGASVLLAFPDHSQWFCQGHLEAVDVTVPSSPTFIGQVWVQGWPYGVSAAHDLAFVMANCSYPDVPMSGLVSMFDVSSLSNPLWLEDLVYAWDWTPEAATVKGDILYVADGRELTVFDVSRPDHPVEVTSTESTVNALVAAGDRLVAADFGRGLVVLDASCVWPMFADDFESGDTGAWSAAQP